jgi:hypothetical protein
MSYTRRRAHRERKRWRTRLPCQPSNGWRTRPAGAISGSGLLLDALVIVRSVSPSAAVADAPELRDSGSYPVDDAAIKGWVGLGPITIDPTRASRSPRIATSVGPSDLACSSDRRQTRSQAVLARRHRFATDVRISCELK